MLSEYGMVFVFSIKGMVFVVMLSVFDVVADRSARPFEEQGSRLLHCLIIVALLSIFEVEPSARTFMYGPTSSVMCER